MKKIGLFAAGVLFDTAETPEKAAETPAECSAKSRLFWRLFFFPMEGNRKYEMYYSP